MIERVVAHFNQFGITPLWFFIGLFIINIILSRSLAYIDPWRYVTAPTKKVMFYSLVTAVIPVTIVLLILIWRSKRSNRLEREQQAKAGQEYDRRIREQEEEYRRYLNSPEGKREVLLEALTDISGVSDKIARTLLDQYPTKETIQAATIEQLTDVPGVGKNIATAIKARLG